MRPGWLIACALENRRQPDSRGMRIAIDLPRDDGTRAHRRAGTTVDDNMAHPDCIAETYLQLHRQHRSTWAFEVVLRPWVERW